MTDRPCSRCHDGRCTSTLTTLCHGCWYTDQIVEAEAQHKPLYDAIHAAIGSRPYVWQSGGMTMTTVVLLTEAMEDGPVYMALVEGFLDDGRMAGSAGFYPHGVHSDGEDYVDLINAYESGGAATGPLYPKEWADALNAHYRAWKAGA